MLILNEYKISYVQNQKYIAYCQLQLCFVLRKFVQIPVDDSNK